MDWMSHYSMKKLVFFKEQQSCCKQAGYNKKISSPKGDYMAEYRGEIKEHTSDIRRNKLQCIIGKVEYSFVLIPHKIVER